jgi:hypothetical protein
MTWACLVASESQNSFPFQSQGNGACAVSCPNHASSSAV